MSLQFNTAASAQVAAQPHPESLQQNLIVILGEKADWAVEASRILNVIPIAEFRGQDAVDVESALGMKLVPSEDGTRILRIITDSGELPVRVTGKMQLRTVERAQVYALPKVVLGESTEQLLAGVVLSDTSHPIFLLKPEGLRRHFRDNDGDAEPGS
jgi:hypothetical protein